MKMKWTASHMNARGHGHFRAEPVTWQVSVYRTNGPLVLGVKIKHQDHTLLQMNRSSTYIKHRHIFTKMLKYEKFFASEKCVKCRYNSFAPSPRYHLSILLYDWSKMKIILTLNTILILFLFRLKFQLYQWMTLAFRRNVETWLTTLTDS